MEKSYELYNCAGSAFETYRIERFSEVWNNRTYSKLEKRFDDFEDIKNAFAEELAVHVAKQFGMAYIPIRNVNESFPVGSVVMRIRDSYMLGADFHFVRKVNFDGETCWISKRGLTPEDLWFDSDVNQTCWDGGYDSQMYLLLPAVS